VLGTYDIDDNGDTTLTDYGVYGVGWQTRLRVDRAREGATWWRRRRRL